MRPVRFDLVVLSTALVLAMHAPALAYLDPGTGSMLVQGILCAIASGLFVLKTYWARLKAMLGVSPAASEDQAQASDQA